MTTVGITYDRREDYPENLNLPDDYYGEFDSETTINKIVAAIQGNGYEVKRIGNIRQLVTFLNSGEHVDLVFNIAEGLNTRGREAQVPALLEAFNIPYVFSDPVTLSISQDKGLTKRMWQWAGLPTANFYVAESLTDITDHPLDYPLFVKPVHEGSSKGIRAQSLARTAAELQSAVQHIINTYQQPALVESYLPGREFTVAILGTGMQAHVLGVVEVTAVAFAPANGFFEKEHKHGSWRTKPLAPFIPVDSPDLEAQLADLALRAFRVIECRDAGRIDIRLNADGQPQLMEINALAGLSPTTSALPLIAQNAGLSFTQLIGTIIDLAIKRNLTLLPESNTQPN